MTLISWIYMGTAWTIIAGLNVYCFVRIFRREAEKGRGEED